MYKIMIIRKVNWNTIEEMENGDAAIIPDNTSAYQLNYKSESNAQEVFNKT